MVKAALHPQFRPGACEFEVPGVSPAGSKCGPWYPIRWLTTIDIRDGLRCTMLLMNGLVRDFTFAATIEGQSKPLSTQMYLPMPDGRTTLASFFSPLVYNAEQMFLTGKAEYPIERTLLTSGLSIAGVEALTGDAAGADGKFTGGHSQPNPESTFWRNESSPAAVLSEYSALSSAMLAYRPCSTAAGADAAVRRCAWRSWAAFIAISPIQTLADRFLVGYPYNGELHME